jgi:hypothetical protein
VEAKGPPSKRNLRLDLEFLFLCEDLVFKSLRKGPSKVFDFVKIPHELGFAGRLGQLREFADLLDVVIVPPGADYQADRGGHDDPSDPTAERIGQILEKGDVRGKSVVRVHIQIGADDSDDGEEAEQEAEKTAEFESVLCQEIFWQLLT